MSQQGIAPHLKSMHNQKKFVLKNCRHLKGKKKQLPALPGCNKYRRYNERMGKVNSSEKEKKNEQSHEKAAALTDMELVRFFINLEKNLGYGQAVGVKRIKNSRTEFRIRSTNSKSQRQILKIRSFLQHYA